MNTVPGDVRPASVAVQEAADLLMVRWAAWEIGGGDAVDAELMGHLNTLDFVAERLAEIEAGRGRPVTSSMVEEARAHAKKRHGWRGWVRDRLRRAA